MRTLTRLAVVLMLVTAACRAEVSFVLDIDEEGSGRFAAELGLDQEMRDLLTAGGEEIDPETIFEDFNLEGVPGATTREETRDDLTFYIAEAPFSDVTALKADFVADPDSPFRSFDLNIGEDEANLTAEISFPDATGDVSGEDLPFDPSTLTEDVFKIAFRVHMPGNVTSHNADRVLSDGSLEWALPLTGGTVTAQATSGLGGGGFPTWLLILAVVALAAVALVVFATLRNRRAPEAAVAAASASMDDSALPAGYQETSAGVAVGEAPEPMPDVVGDVTGDDATGEVGGPTTGFTAPDPSGETAAPAPPEESPGPVGDPFEDRPDV